MELLPVTVQLEVLSKQKFIKQLFFRITVCKIHLKLPAKHFQGFSRGVSIKSSQQFRQNITALALQWFLLDIVPHYRDNIAAVETHNMSNVQINIREDKHTKTS